VIIIYETKEYFFSFDNDIFYYDNVKNIWKSRHEITLQYKDILYWFPLPDYIDLVGKLVRISNKDHI